MRKKIMLVLIVLVLAIACIMPNVLAVAADGARDGIMPISENENDEILMNSVNEEVYDFSENVKRTDENVNGNVYLFANSVNMDNEIINGDVFICANNANLGADVIINGNVFISAMNAKVEASITRGLYVVAKDLVIEKTASVKYDTNLCVDHLVLAGSFDRNVNAVVNNMEVTADAIILKDLNYTSDKVASVSDDATIVNVNFKKQIIESKSILDIVYDYVMDFTQYFVLTFAVLIFAMKFVPNFIRKAKECVRVSSFGLGIVTIVLMPLFFIAFVWLRITATVAIAALVMIIALLLIGMAITNIAIGAKLAERFNKIKLPMWVAIVTIVSWVIYQIPFLGGIVAFFMVATGLGIVIKSNFVKEN